MSDLLLGYIFVCLLISIGMVISKGCEAPAYTILIAPIIVPIAAGAAISKVLYKAKDHGSDKACNLCGCKILVAKRVDWQDRYVELECESCKYIHYKSLDEDGE
jgi:hypothetical protein